MAGWGLRGCDVRVDVEAAIVESNVHAAVVLWEAHHVVEETDSCQST